MPLFDFLMDAMKGISRNRVKDLLAGHGVMVDKQIISRHDFEVAPGMTVQVSRHKQKHELKSKFVSVVYEDPSIIVVEKNVGILSVPATAKQYSVKDILNEYFAKRHLKCTAHAVHRLDRETSGLMMYAKSLDVQMILEEHWREIVTDRRYVAVVCGKMEKEGGTIASWLKDNKVFVSYSSDFDNGGDHAVTHYNVVRRANGYSLLELKLDTGRKNQIRVHMQDMGHPIVGDAKYGNGEDPIGRLALHAFRLWFYHPVTGELMKFETPYPASFRALVQMRER